MDQLKVKQFQDNNPDASFPWFETLTSNQTEHIRVAVAKRANVASNSHSIELLKALLSRSKRLDNSDANSPGFSLISIVTAMKIVPSRYGYIDWGKLDNIDRFNFFDLDKYFDDICLGYMSDDVCVFDDTLNWFLFIMHYGDVNLLRFD